MRKWMIILLLSFVMIGCSKVTSTFGNMSDLPEEREQVERFDKGSDKTNTEIYEKNASQEQPTKNILLENQPIIKELPSENWILPTEEERINYAKNLIERLIIVENTAPVDDLKRFYGDWLIYDKEFDRTDDMPTPSHVRVRFSNVSLLKSTQEGFIFLSKIIEVYGEGEDANEMQVQYTVTFLIENNVFMIANIEYQFYY